MEGYSCSFCGNEQREVAKLIAGPRVFICDECVGKCNDILAEESTPDSGTTEPLRQLVARVAPVRLSLLICGAHGVGKSFIARTIHRLSGRTGDLVTVRCDALERQIAVDLEAARGGTVFLKDVDRLPLAAQAVLLTALEQQADVRAIASTRQDLSAACEDGTFRRDLFARLSVATIEIPPLRQRIHEVPKLVFEFLQTFSRESGRETSPQLTPEAMERLRQYPWPGNVGELQAVIRRALLLSDGPEISTGDLTVEMPAAVAKPDDEQDTTSKENAERQRMIEALTAHFHSPAASRTFQALDSSEPTDSDPEPQCSFCGEPDSQVRTLFRGPDAQICDQCVESGQAATCLAIRQGDEAAGPGADSVAERTDVGCSFCNRNVSDVRHLVSGDDDQMICDGCLDSYDRLLAERFSTAWPRGNTFTLRSMYPSKRIDDSTQQARADLTRGRSCRIVVLADDGEPAPARLLLDRMKQSLADIADFWEAEPEHAGAELTALALPRPAPHR